MPVRRMLLLVSALVLGLCSEATAATCTFTTSEAWETGGDCPGAPTASDTVVISGGTVTVTAVSNPVGHLTISGGTLSLANATTVAVTTGALDGGMDVTGGVVSGTGSVTVAGPFDTGPAAGTFFIHDGADVVLNGAAVHDAGLMSFNSADSTLTINQTYTIATGANATPFGSSNGLIIVNGELVKTSTGNSSFATALDNDGSVRVAAGNLILGGSHATPEPDAVSGGDYLAETGAMLTFNNFHQVGGAGSSITSTTGLSGPGVIRIAGDVRLGADTAFTPLVLQQIGPLTINGTGTVSLPRFDHTGGVLTTTRDVNATIYNVDGGQISGDVTFTVSGSFDKTGAGTINLGGGADLVLDVDVVLDGGLFTVNGGATLTINPNRTFTIADGANASPFNASSGLVVLQGTLVKTSSGSSSIATPVDNDGTVQVSAGNLVLTGDHGTHPGTVSGGDYIADTGTTLTFGNSTNLGGAGSSLTGTGTASIVMAAFNVTIGADTVLTTQNLTQTGGLTINGTGDVGLPNYTHPSGLLTSTRNINVVNYAFDGGQISGDHTLTVTGSADKTGTGSVTLQSGADVVFDVDATLDGGLVATNAGTSVTINAGKIFTITDGANPSAFNTQGGLLTVKGQLRKTGTATTTTIHTPVHVDGGLLSVAAGQVMNLDPLTQTAGATTVAAGGTLGGTNPRTISGGMLTVDGTLQGPTTLTGTGILTGSGQLTGAVTNTAGTVRPGSSPGTLTVGSYNQGSGGTLDVEIAGTTAGTQFDVLAVTGLANLGGTLHYTQLNGFVPDFTDTFQFLTAASRTGVFNGPPVGDPLGGGKVYEIQLTAAPVGARLALLAQQPPANTADPTITPVGSTLTCDPGSWTNSPTFTFAWLRDGQIVAGATSSTLPITGSDATHQFVCRVTATNAADSASEDSAAFTVPGFAPQNTGPPSLTGTPDVGRVLGCESGTWSGAPAPALTFEWLRDGQSIAGATGTGYTATAEDAGHQLSCRVTATNAAGTASATTGAVAIPVPPAPTPTPAATPTPTPTPSPEQVLAAAPASQVAGAFGLPSTRKCLSRRNFTIKLVNPNGVKIKTATVTFSGKRVKARKVSGRFRVKIDLRGTPKKTVVVRINVTTTTGVKLSGRRTYKTCVPKKRKR